MLSIICMFLLVFHPFFFLDLFLSHLLSSFLPSFLRSFRHLFPSFLSRTAPPMSRFIPVLLPFLPTCCCSAPFPCPPRCPRPPPPRLVMSAPSSNHHAESSSPTHKSRPLKCPFVPQGYQRRLCNPSLPYHLLPHCLPSPSFPCSCPYYPYRLIPLRLFLLSPVTCHPHPCHPVPLPLSMSPFSVLYVLHPPPLPLSLSLRSTPFSYLMAPPSPSLSHLPLPSPLPRHRYCVGN